MFVLPPFKITERHYIWHKVNTPMIPKRLVDGTRSQAYGQLWRRRTRFGQWEYRQDAETAEEYDARQR